MIVEVKYFNEKSVQDYETYEKLWDENRDRFVFLQNNLTHKQQMNEIINHLDDNKDILAIRFPNITGINRNKIINDILKGKGIKYNESKIWHPKEIWIYSPM